MSHTEHTQQKKPKKKFHSRFTKYLYERDTIFATLWVFIFIFGLSAIPINVSFFNPIKLGLKDFDYNDISYSKLGQSKDTIDRNIVIINIGNEDREGIAYLIEKTAALGPKIIGLDATFAGAREPQKDSILSAVIAKTKNLVLANEVFYSDSNTAAIENGFFGSVSHKQGFVNMVSKDIQTIRLFHPFEEVNGKKYNSFASALVKEYDSASFKHLEKRKKEFDVINYTRRLMRVGDDAVDKETKSHKRNYDQYYVVEPDALLNDGVDASLVKDKIALLGYINRDPNDLLDKKFTPMNKRFAGKSTPDMNGIVVHANIISMVLDKNYIKKVPSWVNLLIAIAVCWLFMSFFIHYYLESHIWFHLVAKIAQVAALILFTYLGIFLYDQYQLKVDMKMSLIVIVLAVDVIYFYEAWAVWMHKKFGYQTVFKPHHH